MDPFVVWGCVSAPVLCRSGPARPSHLDVCICVSQHETEALGPTPTRTPPAPGPGPLPTLGCKEPSWFCLRALSASWCRQVWSSGSFSAPALTLSPSLLSCVCKSRTCHSLWRGCELRPAFSLESTWGAPGRGSGSHESWLGWRRELPGQDAQWPGPSRMWGCYESEGGPPVTLLSCFGPAASPGTSRPLQCRSQPQGASARCILAPLHLSAGSRLTGPNLSLTRSQPACVLCVPVPTARLPWNGPLLEYSPPPGPHPHHAGTGQGGKNWG